MCKSSYLSDCDYLKKLSEALERTTRVRLADGSRIVAMTNELANGIAIDLRAIAGRIKPSIRKEKQCIVSSGKTK